MKHQKNIWCKDKNQRSFRLLNAVHSSNDSLLEPPLVDWLWICPIYPRALTNINSDYCLPCTTRHMSNWMASYSQPCCNYTLYNNGEWIDTPWVAALGCLTCIKDSDRTHKGAHSVLYWAFIHEIASPMQVKGKQKQMVECGAWSLDKRKTVRYVDVMN